MTLENKHIIDDLEKTPIQMPSDSYFEDLKKNVLDEIKNDRLKKSDESRIIPMYKRWYFWGSAAAILAFVLLFPWNTSDSTNHSEPINLSSVSNKEIYDYLDRNIEDLDAETIVQHLTDAAVANSIISDETEQNSLKKEGNQKTFSSESPLLENIKDEEILDYLKNESGELDEYLLIES